MRGTVGPAHCQFTSPYHAHYCVSGALSISPVDIILSINGTGALLIVQVHIKPCIVTPLHVQFWNTGIVLKEANL